MLRPFAALAFACFALVACSKGDPTATTSVEDRAPQAATLTRDSGHPGPGAAAGALNPAPRSPNTSD
jgi:hypothetical protein